jgi:hypothetical protein
MKTLLTLLVIVLASQAYGAPFLVSDPYTIQSDPNLNPVSFVIHGLGASDITIGATQLSNGTIILEYDLATLPNGQYQVDAAAINVFGGESTFSAPPFAFTKGVPGPPQNLRISPTLLTWVPFGSATQRTSFRIPLRRALAPSLS